MCIVIWGSKKVAKVMGRASVYECPHCQCSVNDFVKITTWFTLFYIPIFPTSTKYLVVCAQCGNSVRISKSDFEAALAAAAAPPTPATEAEPFVETSGEQAAQACCAAAPEGACEASASGAEPETSSPDTAEPKV